MDENTERHWHTLTVRFAVEQPIDRMAVAARVSPPEAAIGHALRDVLGMTPDQSIILDNVLLIPDDIPRPA